MRLICCTHRHAHSHTATIGSERAALDTSGCRERDSTDLGLEATHLLLTRWESLIVEKREDPLLTHQDFDNAFTLLFR